MTPAWTPPIWLATTDEADESDRIMLLSEVETAEDWALNSVDVLRLRLESDAEMPESDEPTVEIAADVTDDCDVSVETTPESDELVVEMAEELAEPSAESDETAEDVTADWLLNADDTPVVETIMLETDADTEIAVRLETNTERLPTIDDTELNDRETAERLVLMADTEVLMLIWDCEIVEMLEPSDEIWLEIDDDSPAVSAACAAPVPSHELIFE